MEAKKRLEILAMGSYEFFNNLYVTLDDVSCVFNTGEIFRPKKGAEIKDQFYHLNWFFSEALTEEEKLSLYNTYKTASDLVALNTPVKPTDKEKEELRAQMPMVVDGLIDCMKDIFKILTIERLFEWVTRPRVYAWPNSKDLPEVYAQAASHKYPESKTYTNREYKQLFAMILQIRAITPLWGGFLRPFKDMVRADYRDMFLLSMFNETVFQESEPYKRLVVYINAWVSGRTGMQSTGVMHGMTEEDFPNWLMANVIVRKLGIQSFMSPVPGDTSPFVVKHLSHIILDLLDRSKVVFNNPTEKNTKKAATDGGPNDDARSVFESNNIKQAVSSGERWTVQIYCEDFERVMRALDPNVNYSQAKEIRDHFNADKYSPTDDQMLLASWIFSTVISPRSEPDLTHANCVNICAAATAYLWQHGHHQVACWLSSLEGTALQTMGVINQGNVRHGKDKYSELEELYPYSEKPKGTGKTYTPVRDTVVDMLSEAEKREWYPQLPKEMLIEIRKEDPNNAVLRGDLSKPVMFIQQSLGALILAAAIDAAKRPIPQSGKEKADELALKMDLSPTPSARIPFEPKIRPLDF